jgi:uncharacterized protein (DUF885 family)
MANDDLPCLAEEFWDTTLAANPTTATLLGDHRFDERIEDLSVAAEPHLRDRWVSIGNRLEAIPTGGLDQPDRVTLGLLRRETSDGIGMIDQRVSELQSDQMQGIQVGLVQTTPLLNAPEPEHARRLTQRVRQVPTALDRALDRFLAGAADGRTPARISIERSINVIDGYLASPLDQYAFTSRQPDGWDGLAPWRQQLADIAKHEIRPVGQREIFRLRESARARARLADRFDIKAFHDNALGSGAVSLPILGDLVDSWVSAAAA